MNRRAPPHLRLVDPTRDPLEIALELGDKSMASAILDGRVTRPIDAEAYFLNRAAPRRRRRPFERLRDPAFLRGALFGFAVGQLALLLLAIIIARSVNG